MRLYGHAPG